MSNMYKRIQLLALEKKGLNVSRMCDAIGMSRTTLSNLKNGKIFQLSKSSQMRIANFLGVSVEELYSDAPVKEEHEEKECIPDGFIKLTFPEKDHTYYIKVDSIALIVEDDSSTDIVLSNESCFQAKETAAEIFKMMKGK